MGEVKRLLDALLWEIYGKQKQASQHMQRHGKRVKRHKGVISEKTSSLLELTNRPNKLKKLNIIMLLDIMAILKVEIIVMGHFLGRVLIVRDRLRQQQEALCACLIIQVKNYDAHPKMRFSLSPSRATANRRTAKSPSKTATAVYLTSPTNNNTNCNDKIHTSSHSWAILSNNSNSNYNDHSQFNNNMRRNSGSVTSVEEAAAATAAATATDADVAASDYNQWLHAMKLVARLPGGTPPEFRRKLWLSLADKYLKSKNVDWAKQQEKCFSEEWREDDEELGIQIVKDLHRTGSNLCTGPAGSINQAKLKRILLGYARYNPEVGYCQGFNMLGALILQVMDKEEIESMKVMIYLVEGVLPEGYFCGSMGGLQADMGVFRELMQTKLPRLAKHLQKLQGPIENAYEPPLTNVFTMQWFLTMFCTCLPMSCVLRVWDLVLIEGSDVLLRTALVLWGLLEKRVLKARTADDFYGKMGSFSSELLNGHLIDSNGLIERVVQLGPIPDIKKLRNKHRYNITPIKSSQGLQLYYDDEEDIHSDEESRLAVATVWGLPWSRRGSSGNTGKQTAENKDRLALDISLLKKKYERLRERQKQAHVILTTACTTATARQDGQTVISNAGNVPVHHLLMGRSAIVTNKGKRIGPPLGAIPPARKPSLPAVLQTKPIEKQLRRGETLHWRDTDLNKRRRDSLTWKEIKADRAAMHRDGIDTTGIKSQKLRTRMGKSDSSSYSEDSDGEDNGSSTDTSLCDEDDPTTIPGDRKQGSSMENIPKRKAKYNRKLKEMNKLKTTTSLRESNVERVRPKSWAPSSHEIPFMLMTSDSPLHSGHEQKFVIENETHDAFSKKDEEDSATESDRLDYRFVKNLNWPTANYSPIAGDLASSNLASLDAETDILELPVVIANASQLSPMPDIKTYLNSSSININHLAAAEPVFLDSVNSLGSTDDDGLAKKYDVNDNGVTNQYFERVNSVERPTKLELIYSLSEEESVRNAYEDRIDGEGTSESKELNLDYKKKLVETDQYKIAKCDVYKKTVKNVVDTEAEKPLSMESESTPVNKRDDYKKALSMTIETKPTELSSAARKRRDPRRLTLTRSSTIDIEERFQELERRLSEDILPNAETNTLSEGIKHIHTIADLEARYNTIEKQLNATKQRIEKQTKEDDSVVESEAEASKSKSEHIPNTADLADRFNTLTKQMSSNNPNAKQQTIEFNDSTESFVKMDDKTNKKKSTESSKQNETKETKSDAGRNKTYDGDDTKECKEKIKEGLKKLPSTAELEDRFNALERKMSIQKSSAAKSKKEPPDDMGKQEAEQDENMKKVRESQKDVESPSELEIRKTVEKEKDAIDKEVQSKVTEESTLKHKTPPSIEELEKRFEALEKQSNTTNLKDCTVRETKIINESKEASSVSDEADPKMKIERTDEQRQKSVDTFQAKCKTINEALSSKDVRNLKFKEKKAEDTEEDTHKTNEYEKAPKKSLKSKRYAASETITVQQNDVKTEIKPKEKPEAKKCVDSFEKKCRYINETISAENSHSKADTHEEISVSKHKDLTKRRASEPPSTEDLEKRYEALKRRMSTKNHYIKDSNKTETVDEALQRIEQVVITGSGEATEDVQSSLKTQDETNVKALPSTEDLESRYKALHPNEENLNNNENILNNTTAETNSLQKNQHVDVAIEAHIPEPPPMPEIELNKRNSAESHPAIHQQSALIEELQSKIKGQVGNENLKPSAINPQSKRIRHRSTVDDETSETPANTAYYRLGNYEPWQSKKMVRRFSDLPSRADLENRLQFLEKQLYKKFYKQRCASDSEVASRRIIQNIQYEKPSTSPAKSDLNLEQRVLALEKQLSENSLKLLETMRSRAVASSGSDSDSPHRLSTETIDAAGKELVRYTHFGELDESDGNKPINININIKMLLNKEGEERKRNKTDNICTNEDLRKRLQQLEQQLSEERSKHSTTVQTETISTEIQNEEKQNDILNIVEEEIVNPKNCDEVLESTEQVKKTRNIETDEKKEEITDNVDTMDETAVEPVEESTEVTDKVHTMAEATIESLAEPTEILTVEHQNENTKDEESMDHSASSIIVNTSEIESVDPNKKTLVLLMANEPKAVKVRRLTRANTEELEGLFQALEQQLNERNLIKSEDGRLIRTDSKPSDDAVTQDVDENKALCNLTKQIEEFTKSEKSEKQTNEKEPPVESVDENYDWGPDPVKHHLKRKTVYLPSTKELEARFRSLERQIKLLEDVEKIDVEQRLIEIERKIKLQYSLSHEKDLNKYLELCEGKGLDDDEPEATEMTKASAVERSRNPGRKQAKQSQYISPSHSKSPARSANPQSHRSPYTSPGRTTNKHMQSTYTSPIRHTLHVDAPPNVGDLEHHYHLLDLVHSPSKEKLAKKKIYPNNPPIHPLEMLLDTSPNDNDIPTTGELEHRIRVLDDKLKSPGHKARSHSPTIEELKRKKKYDDDNMMPKTPIHKLETLINTPTRSEPPTENELEARMRALEKEHSFDFKTQKDYKEFNQKLKDVISPSLSFEEFKAIKLREQSPKRTEYATTPKSVLRDSNSVERKHEETLPYRPASPKVIRFREEEKFYNEEPRSKSRTDLRDSERMVGKENNVLDIIAENTKILERILQKTLTDSNNSIYGSMGTALSASTEGLDALGSRLMRETSPLRRTGTHTGVPLRTGENINDRLTSIKNTIKSIDSLCEEKPYQKEKCQRYIDSLFTDSLHFASKKSSMEDLTHSRSESHGYHRHSDYTPPIRVISDHSSQRPSEFRSTDSAESTHSSSLLRAASPLHQRSNRDLHREISPRRHRNEEREEYESSRVRRNNLLPNSFHDNNSVLSSYISLTKFHKVDRQLDTYRRHDEIDYTTKSRAASRSPIRSPYVIKEALFNSATLTTTTTNYNNNNSNNSYTDSSSNRPGLDMDRPIHNNLIEYDVQNCSNTSIYVPSKLEIRHTTVTSTFYDRLLTEKQLEKSLTRPTSRSPIVSPSITSKSYTDLLLHNSRTKDELSSNLDVARGKVTDTLAIDVITSSYTDSSLPKYSNTTIPSFSNTNSSTTARLLSVNDNSLDLRIRSCENILMQLKSTTSNAMPTVTTTGLTLPILNSIASCSTSSKSAILSTVHNLNNSITSTTHSPPFMFTDIYKNYLITTTTMSNVANVSNTTTVLTTTSSSIASYSTGVCNPLISLTMRQPTASTLLGQYGSSNNSSAEQPKL